MSILHRKSGSTDINKLCVVERDNFILSSGFCLPLLFSAMWHFLWVSGKHNRQRSSWNIRDLNEIVGFYCFGLICNTFSNWFLRKEGFLSSAKFKLNKVIFTLELLIGWRLSLQCPVTVHLNRPFVINCNTDYSKPSCVLPQSPYTPVSYTHLTLPTKA